LGRGRDRLLLHALSGPRTIRQGRHADVTAAQLTQPAPRAYRQSNEPDRR
jgi:hypothetical protein